MSEAWVSISDVTERVTSRQDTVVPEAARLTLSSLGHLGDAATWIAGAQGQWPPRALDDVAEVGSRRRTVERHHSVVIGSAGSTLQDLIAGITVADAIADEGRSAILIADSALSSVPACAAIGLLANTDASSVTGPDLDSAAWMARAGATRDLMRRSRVDMADPIALLTSLDDPELAVLTGVLLGAAARHTPVLLDCVPSLAAALIVQRMAYRAATWLWCSHRPAHPAADHAIDRLDLHPFTDLHLAAPGVAPHLGWQAMTFAVALSSSAD